jgi:hypothetical protein
VLLIDDDKLEYRQKWLKEPSEEHCASMSKRPEGANNENEYFNNTQFYTVLDDSCSSIRMHYVPMTRPIDENEYLNSTQFYTVLDNSCSSIRMHYAPLTRAI